MTKTRDAILDHIHSLSFAALPEDVVKATNIVIADTLACALIGSTEAKADIVRSLQLKHFGFGGVPVWGTKEILAPIGAGMANGYHVHCLEYACCHDAADVHSMSVIFPTVMAYADRFGRVTGKDLITALNIGNDVAVLLGLAATQGAKFYRPGVCGALGAGAAIAKLADLDGASTSEFFGLIYSQLSGTMLAHAEPGVALPLQIAFSVRNVLTAYDMIRMTLSGPTDVFDGVFGYFNLFEVDGDALPHLDDLKTKRRTAEISFKPFPSGRDNKKSADVLLGKSDNPMTAEQHREKFISCAMAAVQPLTREAATALYDRMLKLDNETDVSIVSNLASGVNLEEKLI